MHSFCHFLNTSILRILTKNNTENTASILRILTNQTQSLSKIDCHNNYHLVKTATKFNIILERENKVLVSEGNTLE